MSYKKGNKSYEELTIADDFMFFKVMSDGELCKELLETILGIRISKLVYHEMQAVLKDSYDGKGIRLDVYAADEKNTVYNVEMQAMNDDNLPRRSRYYQSCIDMDLLDKGIRYKKLNNSIVIFICTFDLFKKGYAKYTFNTRCNEDKEIVLEDGITKVFINSTASIDGVDAGLGSLIKYINTGVASDGYTIKIDKAVVSSRKHKSWRNEYMKYQADREDLIEQGEIKNSIKTILRMLGRAINLEDIADMIDVDIQMVEKIRDISEKLDDKDNIDEIYSIYMNEMQNV